MTVHSRMSMSPQVQVPEPTSPCPISKIPIPVTDLECPTTKDAIPMCVVTGRHMDAEDWCQCPNSRFPALYSEYLKHIEYESSKGNEGGYIMFVVTHAGDGSPLS